MTIIIDSHIREVNQSFIGIYMGIPLTSIVYYHDCHNEYVMKCDHDTER